MVKLGVYLMLFVDIVVGRWLLLLNGRCISFIVLEIEFIVSEVRIGVDFGMKIVNLWLLIWLVKLIGCSVW